MVSKQRDKTDALPISNKQKLELTLVSNKRIEEKMNPKLQRIITMECQALIAQAKCHSTIWV